MNNQSLAVSPRGFLNGLSLALELSSSGLGQHHRRTAAISRHLGRQAGLAGGELEQLHFAAMLHDIGAAADWTEKHFIIHGDQEEAIFHHAEKGYALLKDSRQLGSLAEPIRHHHDRFSGGNPSGLQGRNIPLPGRIIHLADRVEILIRSGKHIFTQRERILEAVQASPYFDPELLELLRELGEKEYFWLDIMNQREGESPEAPGSLFGQASFGLEDLKELAELFSGVIDETSHYTAAHSRNVAEVARALAVQRGFSLTEGEEFYLAGLLHDIGKLSVPNEILNRKRKLTEEEFAIIRQHPYYGHRILGSIPGFENIACWAGTHHETLDGRGYPFGLKGQEIELGARILAVADIFSALQENRPYRGQLDLDRTLEIMKKMGAEENIDGRLVEELALETPYFQSLIRQYDQA